MDVVRAHVLLEKETPEAEMSARWLRGPAQDDTLDVAVVAFAPGAATPPHVHYRGQTLVIVSGTGFVEVDGVRTEVSTGDVVVSPPGERHTHGAAEDTAMVHLSVTTGRNELTDVAGPAYGGEHQAS